MSLLLVALDDFALWQLFFVSVQVTGSLFKLLCNLLSRNEAHRFVRSAELTISDAMTIITLFESFNINCLSKPVNVLVKKSVAETPSHGRNDPICLIERSDCSGNCSTGPILHYASGLIRPWLRNNLKRESALLQHCCFDRSKRTEVFSQKRTCL